MIDSEPVNERRAAVERAALRVRCDFCKRQPGWLCRTRFASVKCLPHTTRINRAREAGFWSFGEARRDAPAQMTPPFRQEYAARVLSHLARLATKCASCGSPNVACVGAYEASQTVEGQCDECCGHGNEDGWCESITDLFEAAGVPEDQR